MSLLHDLNKIVGAAFVAVDLPLELGRVRVSDRPDLCQFQCNGAMAAAKIAKQNPRAIAEKIVAALSQDEIFAKVEIAGPGFINLTVSDAVLAGYAAEMRGADAFGFEKIGVTKTVVLDYGGMNVAKAMHVGHLRSLAIGDCLKRLYRYAGYEALGDIHLGDWGLQMGQIISEFEIRNPEWPYFDAAKNDGYPDAAPFTYEELEKLYPEASQACKEDASRLERAREATAELQAGRAGYVALWRAFMELSKHDVMRNIEPLGINFEIWKGESDVNDLIPALTEKLSTAGILEESDGAQIIRVAREDDKQEMPPVIYLKSDGAQTYGTTDLGTIYDRVQLYPNLARIIYETDLRQNLHFEQVFRAAKLGGLVDGVELFHIGHGTINGPDGKPFKTREGSAMKFADMVAAIRSRAEQRLAEANIADDLSAEEREDIAQKVTIAALKFTELSNQAHMDYMFDMDRMTAFEGKTGPYLLYQAVRIRSLLARAGFDGDNTAFQIDDADRDLVLLLLGYSDEVQNALDNHAPYMLCDYIYRLAQGFSSFYGACHIMSEEDGALKSSRLALCALTLSVLEEGLGLLGIETPARM